MSYTSHLLLLLDTIISQDATEIDSVMRLVINEIRAVGIQLNKSEVADPLHCTDHLCRVIHALTMAKPGIVRIASANDGSLPLHFAASLGKPEVAELLLSQVSSLVLDVSPLKCVSFFFSFSAPASSIRKPLIFQTTKGRSPFTMRRGKDGSRWSASF